MALYIIGIGLWDARDITVRGLDIVRKCRSVFLEAYTSRPGCTHKELEDFYGCPLILADRALVEEASVILDCAKRHDTAMLVCGDPLSATTHLSLLLAAQGKGVRTEVVHNASVLTAVGETGLELYKFGRVASIPLENNNVQSPVEVFRKNRKAGLHTLFLLDITPERLMSAKEACKYLLSHIDDFNGVACAGLGSPNPRILYARLSEIMKTDIGIYPQCLVVPGELHFMEEEALKRFAT